MHSSRAGIDDSTRLCAPKLRADLIAMRKTTGGRCRWLIKDPVSLRYFELDDVEYFVLTSLDGRITLSELKETIEKNFPPRRATYEQLEGLLHRFFVLGLTASQGTAQAAAAVNAHRSQVQRRWFGQLVNPLFIKFRGIDPEPLLRWLYPRVRWIFGPLPLLTCLALIAVAGVLLAVEFDAISAKLPNIDELFQAGNLLWLMIAVAGCKVVHELGHAITCKHYGGECHEIGVALFLFTPSLYCDTTDVWMIPNKWQRAAVGAAGMAVEVVLASICLIAFHFSQPGLIHYLCLNTMIVCSVSTLVFNGNPLLRFDGYYILSDVLGIPNLWQTSRTALLRLLQVGFLGLPGSIIAKPPYNQFLLSAYAVASIAYRWIIMIGIAIVLMRVLRPYGLQIVVVTLLALTLTGMVVMPLYRAARFVSRPGIRRRVYLPRAAASLVVVIAIIIAVLFLPVPHSVVAPFVLEQRNAEKVYVTVPGTLEEIVVEPGERVRAGEPIVRLANLEIAHEVCQLAGERDRLQTHLQNLLRRQARDEDAANAIPATRAAILDFDERLRRKRLDEEKLEIAAHREGILSAPPHLPSQSTDNEELPLWSGLPSDDCNVGCFLEVGTLIGVVASSGAMDALLFVSQSDIEFVRPGQPVEIVLNEYRDRTLTGEISQIAQIDIDKVPPVLSHKSGGEISTITDESGSEQSLRVVYQARVSLPDAGFPILDGFHGRAKIDVGGETLGRRGMRLLRQTFMF